MAGLASVSCAPVTTTVATIPTFHACAGLGTATWTLNTRVFNVQVAVPNPAPAWKVGMVATVVVTGAHETEASPAIPLAAVVKSETAAGGYGVYAVDSSDGSDRVRLQPVSL